VILTDARRAAGLLQDIGALWSHPGVAPERRKEFIDEVFEEIQFDQHGIRVVLLRTEYRPLVALAEASRGGEWSGRLDLNQRPPEPHSVGRKSRLVGRFSICWLLNADTIQVAELFGPQYT
jgi:hypothetical protein